MPDPIEDALEDLRNKPKQPPSPEATAAIRAVLERRVIPDETGDRQIFTGPILQDPAILGRADFGEGAFGAGANIATRLAGGTGEPSVAGEGRMLSRRQARILNDAGLLFDSETGQPRFPIPPEFIQELGRSGEGVGRLIEASPLGFASEIGRSVAGFAELGIQRGLGIDGQARQEFAEQREEGQDLFSASIRAFDAQDLPSTSVPISPFRIPLPGGKSFQRVDIGAKGAIEIVADPIELLPGGILLALGRRGLLNVARNTLYSLRPNAEDALRRAINAGKFDEAIDILTSGQRGVIGGGAGGIGNNFIAPLRELTEVADEVVVSNNAAVRSLIGRTGINPSVLAEGDVGKALIGYERQLIAANELVDVAVSSALDPHANRFTGSLPFKINRDGFLGNTGKLWQDVFSRPDDFNLTDDIRAYIDDFHRVIDEAEQLRLDAGLEPLARRSEEGWFYVPRQTKEIRGIEINRPSSPKLQRFYEEASDGFANGVRYDVDPRATLSSHVRSAYREVAQRQLSDVLEPLSIRPRELIPEALRNAMQAALRRRTRALNEVKRLRVPRELRGPDAARLRRQLTGQRRAAEAELKAARDNVNRVGIRYKRALDAARKKQVAPGSLFGSNMPDKISIKMWNNRFFPEAQGQQLEDALGQFGSRPKQARQFSQNFGRVINTIRFLSSVGDFAAPFIQGLPVLVNDPVSWSRATFRHYQAFFDPTVQARFIKDNIRTFQQMARHGVPIGDQEFFAALMPGQGLSPAAALERLMPRNRVSELLRRGGRQTFGRFQSSYNMFLTMSRGLMWNGMERSWVRNGGTLDELGAYIRNMTGGLNSRAVGVGPNQAAVEGVWLAFSPRLLRSTISLVSDAVFGVPGLNGTLRQREAFKSMTQLISGLGASYVTAGLALGKDWEEIQEGLNPLNGRKFMSFQINGDWVGVGGQVRALMQVIARTGSALAPGGQPVGNLGDVSIRENPLIQFAAFRGAPGVRVAGTVAEGLSEGQIDTLPFQNVDNVPEIFLHIGRSALPFTLQGQLEGEQASSAVFAFGGARTTPPTTADLRLQAQEASFERLQREGVFPEDLSFKDAMNDSRFVDAINDDEEVQRLRSEGRREALENREVVAQYFEARDAINGDIDGRIEAIQDPESPDFLGPGRAFRERLSELQRDRFSRLEDLDNPRVNPDFVEAREIIANFDDRTSEFDRDLNAYNEAFNNADPPLENPNTGEYDFERNDAILASMTELLGAERVAEIQAFKASRDTQLENDLREAREVLRDYWEMPERAAEQLGFEDEYAQFLALPEGISRNQFRQFGVDGEKIDAVLLLADAMKLAERLSNTQVARALRTWGYDTSAIPVNPELIPEAVENIGELLPQ